MEFLVTTFEEVNWNNEELLIFPIDSNSKLSSNLIALQNKTDIKIKDVLKKSKFKSNFGQTILIRTAKLSFLLLGTGKNQHQQVSILFLGLEMDLIELLHII